MNGSQVPAGEGSERSAEMGALSLRSLGPEDRFATASLLGLAAIVGVLVAFSRKFLEDGDSGWHVAAGRYIVDTRSVPATDPFSFTFVGHAWHAHEWLAEVIMAGAFNAGGWRGLLLLFALASATTLFLVGRELVRWVALRWAICALAVVGILLIQMALARPHVLAWPLLVGWLLVLLHARERQHAPSFAAIPLMVVWANLHASYIFGLGLAVALGVEALLNQRHDRAINLRWARFVAASVLAAGITPHGVQGFLYPFQVSGMRSLSMIREWQPTTFPEHWPFLAATAALWVLIALRWRQLHPMRIVLLAGLTAMAVAHVRHQMLLVLVAAAMIGPLIERDAAPLRRQEATRPLGLGLAAFVAAALLIALRATVPFEMKDNSAFPLTAISRVPQTLRPEPVFNAYSFGGPLILAGIRPYIDGRADMYGDEFTLDFMAMVDGDIVRFRRADARWRFGWTILPPKAGLVDKLDRERGWRRLYTDQWAVVHARTPAPQL